MNCKQFARRLQQAPGATGEVAMIRHVEECESCRAVLDAYGWVERAFAVLPPHQPSADLADRIVDAALLERARPLRRRFMPLLLTAAACFVIAAHSWRAHRPSPAVRFRDVASSTLTNRDPAQDGGLLFPELGSAAASDPRGGIAVVEVVEPLAEVFRELGRSLGRPVRPIAATTSETLEELLRDIPTPALPLQAFPGMRDVLGPATRQPMGPI